MPSRRVLLTIMFLVPVALVSGVVALIPYATRTDTFDRRTGAHGIVVRIYGVLKFQDPTRRFYDVEPYAALTAPSYPIVLHRYHRRFPFSDMNEVPLTEADIQGHVLYRYFNKAFYELSIFHKAHPLPLDTFTALIRQRVEVWNRLRVEEAQAAADHVKQENVTIFERAGK